MITRREALKRTAAGAAVGAGVIAGCLGGDGGDGSQGDAGGGGTQPAGTPTDGAASMGTTEAMETTGAGPTVAVASTDRLGEILVDAEGMTLYVFTKDEGGESTCYEGCAENWPPLTVDGEPAAGEGVTADLGTTERRDGSMQVTANGMPLYYFARDESPGDTNGQGVGDVWYVVRPDGSKVTGSGTATSAGGYY